MSSATSGKDRWLVSGSWSSVVGGGMGWPGEGHWSWRRVACGRGVSPRGEHRLESLCHRDYGLESLCHRVVRWNAWEDEGNPRALLKEAGDVGFGTLLCTVGF